MSSATKLPDAAPQAEKAHHRVENFLNLLALLILAILPIAEIITRVIFRSGIDDSIILVRNVVLLVGYLGGMLAAREGQHLSVAAAHFFDVGHPRTALEVISHVLAVLFCTALTATSVEWWLTAFGEVDFAWFVPIQLFAVVVPIAFAVMAWRFFRTAPRVGYARWLMVLAVLLGLLLSIGSITNLAYSFVRDIPEWVFSLETFWFGFMNVVYVPLLVILIASAFIGTPLFVVITGVAYLLFARNVGIAAAVPNEGYSLFTLTSIPAIPMFTFVGYVLSESKAGERLFRLFKAVFGWMPGGMVVASIVVSVFFATFTGASGVVILALGGLLYTILHERGNHTERFTVGLLTGVGDLGLLFPPSLVLILYATTAQVSVIDMFLGGLLPGLLTVVAFCIVGVIVSARRRELRYEFSWSEAGSALLGSIWEILLPIIIIVGYFSGVMTLVETGAVSVLYVVIVEWLILRELRFEDVVRAGTKSAMIMGGVLVILAGAKALSGYIVDSRLPFILIEWVEANISSPVVFLLLLNLALLVTGMFMDIFSAVLVVVPLIIPLGAVFGVDPVHLGVIFVANMALGYITPPVGLELFLASYRFGQPLPRIYRFIVPFFLLQLASVLLITYVPWFSTVLVEWLGPVLTG
ncbi:MAG: TRAP transporter large permease subunit [Spirochaetales bacterium]